MLKISDKQLESVLYEYIKQEEGLNRVMELTLNGLMRAEREAYLESEQESGIKNKANGFRSLGYYGHGKQLSLKIPRDRLSEFKPMILSMCREEDERIMSLAFDLYGKGLSTTETGEILGKIYGKGYSSSSISRINERFREEVLNWNTRKLEPRYLAFYIDALHVKVCREHVSSEAFYIVLAVKEDYSREVIGIFNSPTEGAGIWSVFFDEMKERGVEDVGLFITDDLKGIAGAIHRSFPMSRVQKCVVHLTRSLSKNVKTDHRQSFCDDLKEVFVTDRSDFTFEDADEKIKEMSEKWSRYYPRLMKKLSNTDEMQYYFTYLDYDYRVRPMIYTTNWIERFNKSCRRTLKLRNSLPSPDSALVLIAKMAMDKNLGHYSHQTYQFRHQTNWFSTKKTTPGEASEG